MITSRILGIALAVAGALCLYLYIGKLTAERRAAKFETALVEATAALDRQNAAIEALRADGDRRERDLDEARKEGQRLASEARKAVTKVRNTPANGCPTPSEVLEAEL